VKLCDGGRRSDNALRTEHGETMPLVLWPYSGQVKRVDHPLSECLCVKSVHFEMGVFEDIIHI